MASGIGGGEGSGIEVSGLHSSDLPVWWQIGKAEEWGETRCRRSAWVSGNE